MSYIQSITTGEKFFTDTIDFRSLYDRYTFYNNSKPIALNGFDETKEENKLNIDGLNIDGLSVVYMLNDDPMTQYNINLVKNIKRIICNDPATIIFWNDGTKTVVKCGEMDYYDAEVGIKTAILKKLLGNKSNYNNLINKALKKAE